jgi:ribonuclease HII|tara:strand:+ start:464 stop:1063 length:600 start_codon:yes stop_codon:yes gene_type:complete
MKTFYIKEIIEAGVDEAGRGPLFGRVYAAAVILNPEMKYNLNLIKDSKKISKKKLPISESYVKQISIDWSVGYSTAERIDEINILHATQEAMHKAIDGLNIKPEFLLIDGNYFKPYKDVQCNCIIGGDDTYLSIAAASILAKTARDRYIEELCKADPSLDEKYNIKSNKGYGAVKHMEGIKKYGITEGHRKTFGICKNY